MHDLLWFLSGCAVAGLVMLSFTRRTRRAQTSRARPPNVARLPRRYVLEDTRRIEELSASLGQDLSTLASGIEGQAQLLCESLGAPSEFALRAELLWESVRRLRFFCEKMQALSAVSKLELEPTNVRRLLVALATETEDYARDGLQVGLRLAPSLPLAMSNPSALRMAILFLIEGVLDLEPDANTLTLEAQAHETADDELCVRLDIEAGLDETGTQPARPTPSIRLSYLAARNLLASQHATFTLDHTPGLHAVASITMTATHEAEEPDAEVFAEPEGELPLPELPLPPPREPGIEIPRPAQPAPPAVEGAHRYGGVLVVESNPAIRDMLAREVGRSGRHVVACADGVAARTLFEATPDRFELLVLERESRRLRGEELARVILADHPKVRVLLIHPGPGIAVAPDLGAHEGLVTIHKPFGLMELRSSLEALVGPSATRPASAR